MGRTILIVEDEVSIMELYSIMLTSAGYIVESAEDGEVALNKTQQNLYDLILLDIMLPKVSGVDVIRTLRSNNAYKSQNSPVIVITNMTETRVIQEMLALGANKYLVKAALNNQEFVREINSFFQVT